MPVVNKYLHDAIDYALMLAADVNVNNMATISWAGKEWSLGLQQTDYPTSRGESYIVYIEGQDMGVVWENENNRGKKLASRMEMFGLLAKVGDK
jgi:hypothetical protein